MRILQNCLWFGFSRFSYYNFGWIWWILIWPSKSRISASLFSTFIDLISSCQLAVAMWGWSSFPHSRWNQKKTELKDNFLIHSNVEFRIFIGNLIARSIISTESIFYVIKFIEKRLLMRLSQFSIQKLPADSYRLEILLCINQEN